MKKIITILTGFMMPITAHSAISGGQIIGIDFGTTAPVGGATFNQYSDVTITDGATESFSGSLDDTSGAAVAGVGFSVTNKTGQDTGRATGNTGSQGSGLMTDSTVYSDWIISNDAGSGRIHDGDTLIDGSGDRAHLVLTFTGLDNSLTYNLTGGFDNNNANFNAIWQADGQTFTTDASGVGYGSLTGLSTDGSGNLVIYVIRPGDADGQHVTVAGLTLEAVAATAPAIALGDEIRVDFGTTAPGGNYNVINSGNPTITDLVRFSDGAAVNVDLAVAATNPFDNAGNVASTAGLSHIDATDADVYADGLLSAGGDNGAGNDTITLTFTGLNDSLYYDLSGGIARSSNASNFSTTWTSSSGESQIADGTAAGGYVDLKNLASSGGTLTVTLTDNVRQSGVAQLALVATNTPPVPPAGPELPDGVTVYFKPIQADVSVTETDLNHMTVGGSWSTSLPSDSRYGADTADGFRFAVDGAAALGDHVGLILDGGGLDFSVTDVAINFEMLATRASGTGDKHITLIGYDGADEIFRLKYVAHSTRTSRTITATTGDGDESMDFTPLKQIVHTATPSGLQDFRIVLSGTNVSFSGSSLTAQDGPVFNSAQTLTALRWEITGTSTDNQGFWLDDVRIWDGLPSAPRAPTDRPNIIFMLMDDMGYSDVSCYGGTALQTPNLDSLADQGLKSTSFFLPGNVCSPTRAAFLTGAYPQRCGMPFAHSWPYQNHWFLGLHPDEITIAEQCRKQGYKTFMVGKWHLGDQEIFLPHNQGFDHFYGTHGNSGALYDETEVAHASFPSSTLTSLYTQRIRKHIRDSKDKPFFIYYPHNYPHNYPHDPFQEGNAFDGSSGYSGTAAKKRRSDALKEVDWGIGQIVAELEAQGLLENTLFVFTSDNGATPPYSDLGNVPFKGSKYVTWDGGHRVPFIAWWPGKIEAGTVSDQLMNSVDLKATFAAITGQTLSDEEQNDSINMLPALTGDPEKPLRSDMIMTCRKPSHTALRKGKWMYIPAKSDGGFTGSKPGQHAWGGPAVTALVNTPNSDIENGKLKKGSPPAQLYDLEADPNQTKNIIRQHPEVVQQMKQQLEAYTAKMKAPKKHRRK